MFWLITGLVLGVFFYWIATRENFKLVWYEWILAILGFILILYSIQNYSASLVELEPRAAGLLPMIFGIPGLIFALLGFGLPMLRNRKPQTPAT